MIKTKHELKSARLGKLHLSQEAMAQRLGVSLRTYTRYEANGVPDRVLNHVNLMVGNQSSVAQDPNHHAK